MGFSLSAAAGSLLSANSLMSASVTVNSSDFSFVSLFLQADIVVKIVMIGLALASIWAWGIVFEKMFSISSARKRSDAFEKVFWSGEPFEELYEDVSTRETKGVESIFLAAMREWNESLKAGPKVMVSVQMRIEKVMDVALNREIEKLESKLLFLATVGSTAPFVGLFGTVWGIMNSFSSIAASKNTSLAVVAPGIAEALFATALGLLAAIPAVVFYNKYSSDIARLSQRYEGFADEFGAILSRQIEMRK
jgi:biopolymer transport protein TolQ